jgi:hypothetical protein
MGWPDDYQSSQFLRDEPPSPTRDGDAVVPIKVWLLNPPGSEQAIAGQRCSSGIPVGANAVQRA